MKNTFEDKIEDYLSAAYAPYAMLVNGKWGSGKTYYFQEQFELGEERTKIYVSVNGISTTDELAREILFQKYIKAEKESTTRDAIELGKTAGIGLIKHLTKGLIDSDKFVEQALKLVKLSHSDVLIIDDIERIKDPLDYETLLGFISRNFLEKKNAVKVILIANEEFLSERQDSEYYFKIKEKAIWKTLNYQTPFTEVYDNLAENFKTIKPYLIEHKEFTIRLLSRYKIENLRTVLFYFGIIEFIALKSKINIFEQKCFEQLHNSILIICNEYKEGYLSSNEGSTNYLKTETPVIQFDYDFEGIDLFDKGQRKEKEGPLEEKHRKLVQYFSSRYLFPNKPNYKFIKSLTDYVQTSSLDSIELKKEIDSLNKEIRSTTPETLLLNSLDDISLLESEQLSENWIKIIDAMSKGYYDHSELEFLLYTYGKFSKWIEFPGSEEFQRVFKESISNSSFSNRERYNPYRGFKEEISAESETFKTLVELIDDRLQIALRESRKEELSRTLLNLTIEERINFVSLGNFFANASQEKIKELLEVITSSAKRTSNFSRTLYDAKREFRIHRTSEYFKRNVDYFLENLREVIEKGTPQELSKIGIERVFNEYIMN